MPYVCDICKAEFKQASSLNAHKYDHATSKRVYTCNVCSITFQQYADLESHAKEHNKEIKCESGNSSDAASSHQISHNIKLKQLNSRISRDNKRYICHICSKSFASRVECEMHGKKHFNQMAGSSKSQESQPVSNKAEEGSLLVCDLCWEVFIDKVDLQTHILLHSQKT